jgi:hypothetical protein
MSVKVYLAARYGRKAEMQEVAKILEAIGITVTSRWLTEPESANVVEEELQQAALRDYDDIRTVDYFVRFSDDLSTPTIPSSWGTASRMEETGMAEAWGIPIIIIGPKQSVFDRLPDRVILPDVPTFVTYLQSQLQAGYELAEADKYGENDPR